MRFFGPGDVSNVITKLRRRQLRALSDGELDATAEFLQFVLDAWRNDARRETLIYDIYEAMGLDG